MAENGEGEVPPADAAEAAKVAEEDGGENVPEDFQCCVCLELLYKPVVLACGHISCFWCIFKAMDYWQESQCPVCRHSYNHFPSICRLLHSLLQNLYPSTFRRREQEVEEDEKTFGTFSPQFEDYFSGSQSSKKSNPDNPAHDSLRLISDSSREDNLLLDKDSSETFPTEKLIAEVDTTSLIDEATRNMTVQGGSYVNGHCGQVLVTDLPCEVCKELLYRPVVLNCGHVFCEACIINSCDKLCRCRVCQSMQPNGFPKVCLVLEHFLEENFFEEYEARKLAALNVRSDHESSSTSTCSTEALLQSDQNSLLPSNDNSCGLGHKVHIGFGCDYCGMYPIIGERYRCKDCVEDIGFDLCGVCYNSSSKLPGRFNQKHTPEHEFEICPPVTFLTVQSLSEDELSQENLLNIPPTVDSRDAQLVVETVQYYNWENMMNVSMNHDPSQTVHQDSSLPDLSNYNSEFEDAMDQTPSSPP